MKILITLLLLLTMFSCVSENYSNGKRIGVITQFSSTGMIWKSWEGHLNVTQTGMNSSVPFDFSVDNDREDPKIISTLDSAANLGWKVEIVYHETWNKNWFKNRGATDHFISSVVVLDKNMKTLFDNDKESSQKGKVIDTIYVVIDKNQLK